MKILIKQIFIIFIACSQIKPYFCSISAWQDLNKQKLVIGDCHKFAKINIRDKYLLFNFLLDLENKNKKILIICENKNLISPDLLKNNFKNINIEISDLRSTNIFLFIKTYRALIKANNKIESFKLENLLNSDLANIFFFNNLENIKRELENIIDQFKNKINNLRSDRALDFIKNLFTKIETRFADFKNNFNLSLEFLDVIELDLPDLSFILEIIKNEDFYDFVTIITGNDHTIAINNFLEKFNYKLIEQIGLNQYLDSNYCPSSLAEQNIKDIFNKFN